MRKFFDQLRRRFNRLFNFRAVTQARGQLERADALFEDAGQAPTTYNILRLREAIQCYQDALNVFIEANFPQEWAWTQSRMALAHISLSIDEDEANLETAIACFRSALRVYTRSEFPKEWAWVQHNLGSSYPKLSTGDRQENLMEAVRSFQTALQVYTERNFPIFWAETQYKLGVLYQSLSIGVRRTNLDRAIQCYQAASRVYTKQDYPEKWANMQNQLGGLYQNFPTDAPEANLEKAIAYYQAALEFYTEWNYPGKWAETQQNLGTVYAVRPTGDPAANLEAAIVCFENALEVYTEDNFPEQWAMIQSNMGAAYTDSSAGDLNANLEEAIACFDAALRVYTEWDFPAGWARTQHNLGRAYASLATADWEANLRRAISYYQAALRVYTELDFPSEWATAQTNLGLAHWQLAQWDDIELGEAIDRFEAALQVFTEEESPLAWARAQNNLGRTYASFPFGARWNWEKAIPFLRAAMRILTEEDFPLEWVQIQENLAAVYAKLPTEERETNLKTAIEHYRAAFRVRTLRDFPLEWAQIQKELGAAYAGLLIGDGANLKVAIENYRNSLQILTEQDFPAEWASIQNELGDAYRDLPTSERVENLKTAIGCYEAALRVHGAQDLAGRWEEACRNLDDAFNRGIPLYTLVTQTPLGRDMGLILNQWGPVHDWATTQSKLGEAYAELAELAELPTDDQEANLSKALNCFKTALRVFRGTSHDAVRDECVQALRNLSGPLYRKRLWQDAFTACTEAIEVLEIEKPKRLTAASRVKMMAENVALFDRAVVCSVELAQFTNALVYAERGKARNLVETLDAHDRGTFARQSASNDADDSSEERRGIPISTLIPPELRRFQERFPTVGPDLVMDAPPPLTFADIRGVVQQANAVLVEFRVTDAGTFVFLLSEGDADMTEQQVVRVPEFTSDMLNEMLIKREDSKVVDGWLATYYQQKGEVSRQEWLDTMDRVTCELYGQLLRPVHKRLKKLYPYAKRLILVPNKGLNLLPLHAAHYRTNGQRRYWLDDYEIIYAPSCAVLQRCLQRDAEREEREALFAVQNPSGDLPFSDWDVQEAAQYFSIKHILHGDDATLEKVKEFIAQGHEVLLSCHGVYNLNDAFDSHLALYDNDKLRLSDILQLDLSNAWLIVLSACETAVSDFRDIVDEVQGLHTAFLIARASTVVGSLWAVNDLSTALLMKQFHENLYEHGMEKASALRKAQQWVRDLPITQARQLLNEKRTELQRINARERLAMIDLAEAGFNLEALAATHDGKPFAHPYWWAGFQCMGAGWQPEGGQ